MGEGGAAIGVAGFGGTGGPFGNEGFVAGSPASSPSPRPTMVIFIFAGDIGGGAGATGAVAPLALTENVCPHFGQRILSPCGGTRLSST